MISDSQYISFSLSTNIMAYQVSNGQFCHINSPIYTVDSSNSCSYALFLQNEESSVMVCNQHIWPYQTTTHKLETYPNYKGKASSQPGFFIKFCMFLM